MLNREVFYEDPGTRSLPNLGVARVAHPDSEQDWETLRFELSHFVSDGAYGEGLDRLLSTFATYVGQEKQPNYWISGFFGSGKSHFLRVLEHLWVDTKLPDGSTARDLVDVEQEVEDALQELATEGKRNGGMWAAAGSMLTVSNLNPCHALVKIVFAAAGLPNHYGAARLVIWLKQEGLYEAVEQHVVAAGKSMDGELKNLYVAQALPAAVLAQRPGLAESPAALRDLFKEQFPNKSDIEEAEMIEIVRDVLTLQSTTPGELPLTMVILDEVQMYLGEDVGRTSAMDSMVQALQGEFQGRVAVAGAGQSAMGGTQALTKLKDRFKIPVQLGDQDVETVIRKVVLRKAPDKVPDLEQALDRAAGEISRHLGGSKIAATASDGEFMVADYPILPTRRRFWEHFLRAVDRGGSHSQLRTQLAVAHEAVQAVASAPIDTVVGADFIYDKQVQGMIDGGVLTRDTQETIEKLRGGAGQRELPFRVAATVFMIDQLKQVGSDIGVKADETTVADLLVERLDASSAEFRNSVKECLASLADGGPLVQVDGVFTVVTKTSMEWRQDFVKRRSAIAGDSPRLTGAREDLVRAAVNAAIGTLTIQQGASKTPRRVRAEFGAQPPTYDGSGVPVWVRTEWDVTEKSARQDAAAAGTDNPVVHVLLPKLDAQSLNTELARWVAAQETIDARPAPTTEEGIQAKKAIESERDAAKAKVDAMVARILEGARVFLGGGADAGGANLKAAVEQAANDALVRLFPRFGVADSPSWLAVSKRVAEGSSDALKAIGYDGPTEQHPVVKEVLASLKGSGTKGTDVRAHFVGIGFGWPQDAVDASLLVLVQGGWVRADLNGTPVSIKQLNLSQVGKASYRPEEIVVTVGQRIAVRGLISELAGIAVTSGEEGAGVVGFLQHMVELATRAGGPAPAPASPDAGVVKQLQLVSGNEQIVALLDAKDEIATLSKEWTRREKAIADRQPRYERALRLAAHARQLPMCTQFEAQLDAIKQNRLLLDEPDLVLPIVKDLEEALREALAQSKAAFEQARQAGIEELEADPVFSQLSLEQRQGIVKDCHVAATDMPAVATDEGLLAELDQTSLSQWDDRTDGLKARFERAREMAAALLAPTKVDVHPPNSMLRTKGDVDAYIEALRSEIMKHVQAGQPVNIS